LPDTGESSGSPAASSDGAYLYLGYLVRSLPVSTTPFPRRPAPPRWSRATTSHRVLARRRHVESEDGSGEIHPLGALASCHHRMLQPFPMKFNRFA